jgi:hypothetical protein
MVSFPVIVPPTAAGVAPGTGSHARSVPVASIIPDIQYVTADIGALQVDGQAPTRQAATTRLDSRHGVSALGGRPRLAPRSLLLGGMKVAATDRFWTSLFRRCGFNDAVFRYFSTDEVFRRVSERDSGSGLRFAVEHGPHGTPRLLAVSSPRAAMLSRDDAMTVISANGGEQVRYTEGRIYSTHLPADGPGAFKLGPDRFEQRFSLEVPLDGFGMPAIHVMLLRLICQNGAVAMQRALRSDVRLGERPDHALDRALGSFGNADGFSAMRQRFESAQRSWASLEEVRSLEAILSHGGWGGGDRAPERRGAWGRMTGDLHGIYGITTIDGISPKRRRLLPARCRMYDLLNFASEMSTHHAPPGLARRLDGWIGDAIVDEFDLEGSAKDVSDFEALFTETRDGHASRN